MEKYIIIAAVFFTVGCFVAAKIVKYAHEVELKIQEVYEYIDRRISAVHTHLDVVAKQASTDEANLKKAL